MPGMSPPLHSSAPARAARVPRLLTNTGWNLAGQLVPLLVGLAVLPLLIRTLGLDRYGFLTLVWVLVGYASVFDLGIGRAIIRVVALRLSRADPAGAHHIARVGLSFMGAFGLVVGSVFALSSAWLVEHVFTLPPALLGEALGAMGLLAASLPFVMLTSGYTGVLAAHEQFRGINIVRALMGVASYVGPLLLALWVNRLDVLVAFTLVMRVLATAVHAVLARRSCGFTFRPLVPDRDSARELLSLGGWMSVSNLISPMLSYLDRLLLGALVPVRMVAFYATPFDLVNRSTILPQALMASIFPAVAAVEPGSDAARRAMLHTTRLLFVVSLPVAFTFVALARPGLQLWLGDEFAELAAPVLQVLAVGVMLNMLAQAPATLIQAAGQPRVMALLHLAELPVFVAVLYLLTQHFGIVGTAVAAALRSALDGLAVWVLARRDVARGPIAWRHAVVPGGFGLGMLGVALWPTGAGEALLVTVVGLLGFGVFAWQRLLHGDERQRILQLIGMAR